MISKLAFVIVRVIKVFEVIRVIHVANGKWVCIALSCYELHFLQVLPSYPVFKGEGKQNGDWIWQLKQSESLWEPLMHALCPEVAEMSI